MAAYNFTSETRNLIQIEELVHRFLSEHQISSSLRDRIVITSLEAMSNSIKHGNGEGSAKSITFVLEKHVEKVVVIVEDEGDGFDYDHLPDPTTPENILNLSGRGVFLMRKLTDTVVFNERGNRVELYFNI